MATLKIYNDIVGEEDKVFLKDCLGLDGICYKDIHEFIASIPKNDNDIDIRIHCRGGSCVEGWAIYDALRASGKNISTTIEGECSSMATIILLSAPLENRNAMKNAHICIHNPAACYPATDHPMRMTAEALDKIISQLNAQYKSLKMEQDKILSLYVERTGSDAETLQALMDEDIFIDTDKAIELGFISGSLAPNTAIKNLNSKYKRMEKKEETIDIATLKRLLARSGFKNLEDARSITALEITTANGETLTVEREDGDPQVGDTAYPDGTFVTDDGTTIVVDDSLITSITSAEENEENEAPEGEDSNVEELKTKIDELEKKVATMQEQVDTLTSENESMKSEIESKKDARILSDDEKLVLAKVKRAGGLEWLNKVCCSKSTFTPPTKQFEESKEDQIVETKTQKAIREQRESAEAKRAARK